ncbi:MAG: metallopeptidase family protein [Candidatus Omnitrophica bacterium]|nr:metallopeptidase family protein [Candidatus Omnitrophota bacterium]
MNRKKFEKLVIETLEALPRVFKNSLKNIDVVIEDEPSAGQEDKLDASHCKVVLGLYQGVPLSRRSHCYGMVMPDKVYIFQKNIEKVCGSDEEITRLVRRTVQHELAHHFGISDQRMRDLDVY